MCFGKSTGKKTNNEQQKTGKCTYTKSIHAIISHCEIKPQNLANLEAIISHCEIKSQNLANLEANSHKIFQLSKNFQTILQHIL